MYLCKLFALATVTLALAAGASAQDPGRPADVASFDIANVKLGMTAEQAIAGLRQTYGQNVSDWKVKEQSLTESIRMKRDMKYDARVIFYALSNRDDEGAYIDHIFYNGGAGDDGRDSLIINLAKPPGQEAGPARVYQVVDISRKGDGIVWQARGTVVDAVAQRAIRQYGAPTFAASAVAGIWCAGIANNQCAPDKPYLAVIPIRETFQSVKSMMQLYDPAYKAAAH